MVVRNASNLIGPVLALMVRFRRKVFSEGHILASIGNRRTVLGAIGIEALQTYEQRRRKAPNVGIGLGRLALVQGCTTRHALILVNRINCTLSLYPIMKGSTSARHLEHIEGLPAIRLVVAGVALGGLAHHPKEHIDNGATMTGEERSPSCGS